MKKVVPCLIIFQALFLISLLGACQKESINGHLDGRWQVMEIEKNGVTENVKKSQLYYNFYLHVCNLSTYGTIYPDGTFSYENNMLEIYFPTINSENYAELLTLFGIYSNPVVFEVDYISKDKMILKEGEIIITLRKF